MDRQDRLTERLDRGQVSLDEYQEQSIVNFGVSGAQLGLTAATGAAGGALAQAGAGVGTRIATTGAISAVEKFGVESLEIQTGFKSGYSSWDQYAIATAFGGLFGAGGSSGGAQTAEKSFLESAHDTAGINTIFKGDIPTTTFKLPRRDPIPLPHLHGPFHRRQNASQNETMVNSGYVGGVPARNIFATTTPAAKGFEGPLPSQFTGIEFYTPVVPCPFGTEA